MGASFLGVAILAVSLPAATAEPPQSEDGLLAETVGLLMHYAWLSGDRALFEQQVSVVEDQLVSPCGLLSWRVFPAAGQAAPASASIDDLKVVRALLAGGRVWAEPGWAERGRSLADAVLRLETVDGVLVEAASWDGETVTATPTVQTAYLDLKTISLLIPFDARWLNVYSRALDQLRTAGNEHGLFPRVVPQESTAATGEVNAIHVLYCAIHLAEVNEGGQETLRLLRGELDRTGKLAGRYRLDTAEAVPGFESVAVHALAARLALLLGEPATARRFLDRMLEIQLLDPVVAKPGRSVLTAESHTFDNLQALIALREEVLSRTQRSADEGT